MLLLRGLGLLMIRALLKPHRDFIDSVSFSPVRIFYYWFPIAFLVILVWFSGSFVLYLVVRGLMIYWIVVALWLFYRTYIR